MNDDTWNQVKDFYTQKFGIAPELVDIAPVLDLLRLCASGSSNKTIALFYEENEEWLADMFDAYLGFRGWQNDLKFSPLMYYKQRGFKTEQEFIDEVTMRFGYNPATKEMYNACVVVEQLERLFDEKWI
jgi:hypothetical protein